MIQTLAIANYRSLRQLVVPLGRLNVITGANGSGKTNLYRAPCGGCLPAAYVKQPPPPSKAFSHVSSR